MRLNRTLVHAGATSIAAPVAVLFVTAKAIACPFCSSEIGRQVRAAVFGGDFVGNLATASLPFVLLAVAVALIQADLNKRTPQ
jgi:hypothetical protein